MTGEGSGGRGESEDKKAKIQQWKDRQWDNALVQASNDIHGLAAVLKGVKVKEDDEVFGPAIKKAQNSLMFAEQAGHETAELEANLAAMLEK